MPSYEFLSTWLVQAPRSDVWSAIEDAEAWPRWWRGVVSSEQVDRGHADGIGRRYRVGWRSFVPYVLEFDFTVDAVTEPGYMAGHATGALEGSGTWRLYEQDGVTAVTYDWRVRTTKPWMNLVAPVGRPVFHFNHNWVMRRGGEGLAARLGVPLLATT